MAKGYGIDFSGLEDLAEQIDLLGNELLKKAVNNALEATTEYVNNETEKAMKSSHYNFSGTHHSKGRALRSLQDVKKLNVEWNGDEARAYAGVDLGDAVETLFIMYGTPTNKGQLKQDKNLYRAIRVKGKHRKAIEELQQEAFKKVLKEGQ